MGLHGTPTTRTLEAQISALHGAERTMLVPSGQAAVSMVFLGLLAPGDRVLIPDNVYPPVRNFCAEYLGPRGIAFAVYDPMIGAGIADLIDDRTRLVWLESPGSGTMEVQDLPAIAEAAHARGALVGIDNTWATGLLFKPLDHGADIVSEALTKYVGGHSDLLLGSISVRDLGIRKKIKDVLGMLGIGVSPDEAALALRGIETMAVRLAHMGRVSVDMARRLAASPLIEQVLHPALPSCPGHDVFLRDFKGASGLFSVVLKPAAAKQLAAGMDALKVFAIGASWGGTRSLLAPQLIGQDRSVTPWPHDGPLLRISIGLEDPEDLWADLQRMLAVLAG